MPESLSEFRKSFGSNSPALTEPRQTRLRNNNKIHPAEMNRMASIRRNEGLTRLILCYANSPRVRPVGRKYH